MSARSGGARHTPTHARESAEVTTSRGEEKRTRGTEQSERMDAARALHHMLSDLLCARARKRHIKEESARICHYNENGKPHAATQQGDGSEHKTKSSDQSMGARGIII
jgi:hypothetical protein